MIAVIDNYDSFTYNLVQLLGEIPGGGELRVFRNDAITPQELAALRQIILSFRRGQAIRTMPASLKK